MEGITLESTEAAFCEWRAQRRSRAEPIPDNLWAMALRLYPQYKRSKICHRLQLSGSHFNQRLDRKSSAPTDNGFVLASREVVKTNLVSSQDIELSIQGKERVLTLCISIDALPQILSHVVVLL